MLDEPVKIVDDRKVTYSWYIGERTEIGFKPRTWDVYAELEVSHFDGDGYWGSKAKHYVAALGRSERRDGTVQIAIGGPYRVQPVEIGRQPCPRFNAKRLDEFAAQMLGTLRLAADDELVKAHFVIAAPA